jgi:hypothetical protein
LEMKWKKGVYMSKEEKRRAVIYACKWNIQKNNNNINRALFRKKQKKIYIYKKISLM